MKSLRLLLIHSYYECLELGRQPMYVLATVIFPSMFFWFFGVPNANEEIPARLLTGSFAAFGVLGVLVFQFGVGIAQERSTPWASLLRILPLPSWAHLSSKLLAGIIFSIPTVAGVLLVAELSTKANLDADLIGKLAAALLFAGLPFGLLGLIIGLSCSPRSALPMANMVYLPLSFAGGLWLPPNALPKVVQDISEYLPTRFLGEVVWSVTLNRELPQRNITGLAIYFLVFLGVSLWLHRNHRSAKA